MKIKVLAILPGLIPSTIIDVVNPLSYLHKVGRVEIRITIETLVKKRDLDWCDIVILCRNMQLETADWFIYLQNRGVPYIYDLDDNFFEARKDPVLGSYFGEPSRFQVFQNYIKHASLVRAYSTRTQRSVFDLNSCVEEVKSPIAWDYILPVKNKRMNSEVNIVYSTSRSQDYLADIFKPALVRVLEKYSSRVTVHFLGYNPPEFKKFNNVKFQPIIFDYEKFLKNFSRAGYDIGLAPLLNDEFHLSKTNNKFREYAASHIAGIYSNVEVYSNCVAQNRTGILVENDSSQWFDVIEMLIEKMDIRVELQKRAYEQVRAAYSQTHFAEVWFQQISRVLADAKAKSIVQAAEASVGDQSHERHNRVALKNYSAVFRKVFSSIRNLEIERLENYIKMILILWKLQMRLILTTKRRP